MLYAFREPIVFTLKVNFSQIASIFTFSIDFFSHLAAFSHLRVPQTSPCIHAGHLLLTYNNMSFIIN